ncbi:MAG: enoyl-CoA hydratase-related protein, partial [Actinomycetota bacterium]
MSLTRFEVDQRNAARLTLSRPEVRNAFNEALISEITEAVRTLPPQARVLVLQGEGPVFSAGADLEWMRGMAGYSREENRADSSSLEQMFAALDSARVPVIGRIHGAAIAGAIGLVACCDYAVAAAGTKFAFTEVKLGLVPAVISPYVVRKVGYSFARAMFLTAETFDADRAMQAGLVHRVVPEEGLDGAVNEVVSAILEAGPSAAGRAREMVEKVWNRHPSEVADYT